MTHYQANKIVKQDINFILKLAGPELNRLRNKNILMTGASGFIGSYLLNSIISLNDIKKNSPCKIFVLVRNIQKLKKVMPRLNEHKNIIIICDDVRTFNFPSEKIDYVIHAASPTSPNELSTDPIDSSDIIVNGTKRILQQSKQWGAKRILYISSGAVYGPQPSDILRLSEDYKGGPDITNSNFLYGEAKRYAEILCNAYYKYHSLSTVIARPFTFVGPYQNLDSGFAVTEFIKSGLQKKPICILGDGTPVRSYCYVADLTIALWKILLDGKEGCAYNIGSEEEISIIDLARKIIKIMNLELKIETKGTPIVGQKIMRYVPDITKLKSEFNFNPKYQLNESLERTIAWHRENMA